VLFSATRRKLRSANPVHGSQRGQTQQKSGGTLDSARKPPALRVSAAVFAIQGQWNIHLQSAIAFVKSVA
jgi:hypothetical protein